LFYAKGTALVAQRFDPVRGELGGDPAIVSETVRLGTSGRAMFSVRPDALVFRSGALSEPGFTWDVYDQRGQVLRSLPLRILRTFVLSPDGTQIALHSHDSGTGDGEFSLVQLDSGTVTRIYTGPLHYDSPVWSPDGRRLAVVGGGGLMIIGTDGTPDGGVLVPGGAPTDWVARGNWIVYSAAGRNSGQDILALPLSGDRKPRVLVQTRADDRNGVVSADGEWLAYTSLESGRPEVYVQRFPAGGNKVAISSSGASHARWDPGGTALYYWSGDERVMRVPIRVRDGALAAGDPVAVLALKNTGPQYGMDSSRSPYVLGPKGIGFIGAQGDGNAVDSVLHVVLNWRDQLERRGGGAPSQR
jgi:eukaryotic-like serine/threonine-protein kinase